MRRIELTVLTIAVLFTFVASASANGVPVPEGGATVGLFAISLIGLAALRRKLSK